MARTHVILPDDLLEEIDNTVGERRRSEFLTQAAENELKRRRLREIDPIAAGSLCDADTPPEWATTDATAEWVRAIRRWPDPWNVAIEDTDDTRKPS